MVATERDGKEWWGIGVRQVSRRQTNRVCRQINRVNYILSVSESCWRVLTREVI